MLVHKFAREDPDIPSPAPSIEDCVTVGMGAIIIGPVRIASDAYVAAGAVVRDDVPQKTLVAGVPARVIGSAPESYVKKERQNMGKEE